MGKQVSKVDIRSTVCVHVTNKIFFLLIKFSRGKKFHMPTGDFNDAGISPYPVVLVSGAERTREKEKGVSYCNRNGEP